MGKLNKRKDHFFHDNRNEEGKKISGSKCVYKFVVKTIRKFSLNGSYFLFGMKDQITCSDEGAIFVESGEGLK